MLENSAYSILGVQKGISDKDLKIAYVNLVRKYDPEKHTERFMVIQNAYDRLRKVKTRVREDVFSLNIVKGEYLIQKDEQWEEGDEPPSEEIVSQLRAAHHEDPGDGETREGLRRLLFQRAHYHVVRKQFNEAIRDWREVLQIDPTNVRARHNLELASAMLGISYAMHGLHQEAIEVWEQALELNPDNLELIHNIALTAEKARMPVKADRYWTEIIGRWKKQLDSDHDNDYLRLIIVEALNHQAEYQEDHPEISEEEEPDEERQRPPSGAGGRESSTGSGASTVRPLPSRVEVPVGAVNRTPGTGTGVGTDAPSGGASSRSRDVISKLRSGGEKGRGDAPPSAGALSGIERYRDIIRLKPDDFEAHYQLCNKLMEHKMYDEALTELTALAKKHPKNTEVLNLMGWALLNTRQKEKAFACWKRSLAIDPKNAATRDNLVRANLTLGKSYRQKGLFTPAMVHFKQLLALMPRSPEVHLEIAATYDMKGDVRAAISAYNQVLALDPKNKVARRAINDLRMKR